VAILSVVAAFALAFALAWRFGHPFRAWLASCAVVPVFVLLAEFVLPYQGGGASMWPIAMVFGSVYGAIAGGIGAGLGWGLGPNGERET
jgi:hypothetical protein